MAQARFSGTMTGHGLAGLVMIRKSEIRSSILSRIAGMPPAPQGKGWHEVSSMGSCKLMRTRVGAVTRYAVNHYGQYDCCRKAEIELNGHATYGTSKASMPIWMRDSLDGYWPASWQRHQPGKVLSWTRTTMDTGVVVVESIKSGFRYEIKVERGLTDGSNLARNLDRFNLADYALDML